MPSKQPDDHREGVALTNLDHPLFDGSGVTKRQLVDYLDAVSSRLLPELRDRPLSVVRVTGDQAPFMQKNVPKYAPDFVRTVTVWAEASRRDVHYALCDDRPTLLWFANQRAVEYHPTLTTAARSDHATHLVLDLDPPDDNSFDRVVETASAVRDALAAHGLRGAIKTSGAKGLHIIVPVASDVAIDDAAAATRAIAVEAAARAPEIATTEFVKADRGGKVFVDSTRAGGATVVAAYSPRVRPGCPVSFPVSWDDLADVRPAAFTITNALAVLGDADPWREALPEPQPLPAGLVADGHSIATPRVAAMHEGKRRKRAAGKSAP